MLGATVKTCDEIINWLKISERSNWNRQVCSVWDRCATHLVGRSLDRLWETFTYQQTTRSKRSWTRPASIGFDIWNMLCWIKYQSKCKKGNKWAKSNAFTSRTWSKESFTTGRRRWTRVKLRRYQRSKLSEQTRTSRDWSRASVRYCSTRMRWKDYVFKNESIHSFWRIEFGISGTNSSYRNRSMISRLTICRPGGIWFAEIMYSRHGRKSTLDGSSWWPPSRWSPLDVRSMGSSGISSTCESSSRSKPQHERLWNSDACICWRSSPRINRSWTTIENSNWRCWVTKVTKR